MGCNRCSSMKERTKNRIQGSSSLSNPHTQLSGELLAVLKNNIPNGSSSEGTETSTGTFANWNLIIFQSNTNGTSLDCSVFRAKFIDTQIEKKKKKNTEDHTDIKVVKSGISRANILISHMDISHKFDALLLCIWVFGYPTVGYFDI